MQNIAIVGNAAETLILFRLDLIKSLVNQGYQVFAFSPAYSEEQENKVKSVGAIPIEYEINRTGLNPFKELSIIFLLKRLFKQNDIDVVLSYFIKPVIYGSIAAKLSGVRSVNSLIAGLGYTFTSDPDSGAGFKRKILRIILSLLFKFSLSFNDKVFFQNPDDLRYFVKRRIVSPKKVARVFGSGVHLERYPFQKADSDTITFMTSGRLIEEKGFIEFTKAANLLKDKYQNVRFVILGGIDENPNGISLETVEEWKTNDVIEWPGMVSNVDEWLYDSSVFVLASYYREGTPRSILEAMSTGRPIITTNQPGCKETVEEGINGFLVPPKNHVALASAMEKFITNPNIIHEMGEKSRQMAEKYYDVKKVNRSMIKKMNLAKG